MSNPPTTSHGPTVASTQPLTSPVPPFRSVPAQRVAALQQAVELGVDEDDIALRSVDEAELWQELTAEFDSLVKRLGPVWVAD